MEDVEPSQLFYQNCCHLNDNFSNSLSLGFAESQFFLIFCNDGTEYNVLLIAMVGNPSTIISNSKNVESYRHIFVAALLVIITLNSPFIPHNNYYQLALAETTSRIHASRLSRHQTNVTGHRSPPIKLN